MLKLNCLMLSSENPKALADFYGKVLEKKPEMEDAKNSFTGFVAGDCFLSIGPHDKVHGQSQNPERMIFFFETADVEAEFDRIKAIAGASVIKEPYSPSSDGVIGLATLADPDGNYFQLATPWKQ